MLLQRLSRRMTAIPHNVWAVRCGVAIGTAIVAIAPAAGLANQSNLVEGDTITDSLDALVDLISQLEANLATPTAIVIDPLGWGVLRKLKVATDWNQSLLGAGTVDATPMLLSLPVMINVGCPQYSGYVLDRNAVVSAVGPVRIAVSEHQFFSSDSVLIRGTWRTGFAVTRPRAGRPVRHRATRMLTHVENKR